MKIATWNVERPTEVRGKRKARLAAAMRARPCDVWILTETVAGLVPDEGYSAVFSGPPDREGSPDEHWVAIWSRYEVLEKVPTVDSARTVAVRLRVPGVHDLIIYGTVLPWLGSPWRDIPAAGGQAFGAAVEAQREDWRRCRDAYPDAELVVAGDLNQDFAMRSYYGSRVNRAVLTMALSSERLEVVTGASDDPVPAHAPKRASIDHICVSARMKRRIEKGPVSWPASVTPDARLSDHFGISVEFADG